jgi:HEAT repeat protein
MAATENDHARIKQCLDELVALGDVAVVPLNDLVRAEGPAGLWAAEALARIGTPLATTALLETLSQTKESRYKEELGKRVSSISNHDSWPVLLDSALQTGDATVLRAAGASLSMMADTAIVDGIIARYEAAATEAEIERLTQMVSNIQSPRATDALLSLAGHVSSTPQDSLQEAAIEALARVGDPQAVSHLLRRLEAAPPGKGTELFNAITRISSPEAQVPLLYAAAGSKEVSAEHGQTAAIYALGNYPDTKTCALLERIIAETANERVLAAATRTLDDIRLAPHAVTAMADSMPKEEEHILPPPPAKE